MKLACTKYPFRDNSALLSLNRIIFDEIMNGVDYPDHLPAALKVCYNSVDPSERTFEAYILRLREDPDTSNSLKILSYMVNPAFGTTDELVSKI